MSVTPAAEGHHYYADCSETGIWTESGAARMGGTVGLAKWMYTMAWVGHVPNAYPCYQNGVLSSNQPTTQHSSLHAWRGSECLETVGQRYSTRRLYIWGYNCGQTGAANVHDLGNYGSPWVALNQQSRNGTGLWDHWYYRYDTNQWIFLGATQRSYGAFYPWLESSGYNQSAVRETTFMNFAVQWADGSGTGSTNFPCPETVDEPHQEKEVVNPTFRANGANSCY